MHRKRDEICGYQRQRMAGGELDEGSQKVQTSGYEINKYEGCNVQMMTIAHTAIWYTGDLLRE